MYEYIGYTKQGQWRFYADSDLDALRLALFYSWRDGEEFFERKAPKGDDIKVESSFGGQRYTLRLSKIDKTNSIQTL